MARIVSTQQLAEGGFGSQDRHYLYNALDCCVTSEVHGVIDRRLNATTRRLYKFEMGLQAAAMGMMLRGVLVDEGARSEAVAILQADEKLQTQKCNALLEGWDGTATVTGKCPEGKNHKWPRGEPDGPTKLCGKCGSPRVVPGPFNPLSPQQAAHYFYDIHQVPPKRNKTGAISTDDECLKRLAGTHPEHADVVATILAVRGIRKQISVLSSGVSSDGRMRSSFNIGAAWTGRQSSSSNPFDEGTNLQNITEKLRFIFIAEPGRDMFYADLEQAESLCVAYLAGDEGYIAAHKGGDVHTHVARLVWPALSWTGDDAKDKILASTTYPDWGKEHPYRLHIKRVQHGSNYLLSPLGMARIAHIPRAAAEEAQAAYFTAFPNIRAWQRLTVGEVRATGCLTSPVGRRCQFFGRLWDDHTHKQAVAFKPQSMVADILDTAMANIYRDHDPKSVWLLAQVHDALLGTVREGDRKALRAVLDGMAIPVEVEGIDGQRRTMTIGTDITVGKNWGKWNDNAAKGRINLLGQKGFKL